METGQIIMATIGFLTLCGGIITVYVRGITSQALLKQENEFIFAEVTELKKTVTKLEDDLFAELKSINHSINDLKLAIKDKQDKTY